MIPRLHSNNPEIREKIVKILESDNTIKEKAEKIYRVNYNMCCRENDGRLPKMMTVNQIASEIIEMDSIS